MKIWVDADACPKVIKEILFRAAKRVKINVTLVANQWVTIPRSPFINFIQVASGLDMADAYIIKNSNKGDLVITADIPLAAEIVKNNGFALDPRGELYSKENIGERLSKRNLCDELRSTGKLFGGAATLGSKEKHRFANSLDRFIMQ